MEYAEAWGQAVDYKVDVHLLLLEARRTKNWQKIEVLEKLYKRCERVADRLAKKFIKVMKDENNC